MIILRFIHRIWDIVRQFCSLIFPLFRGATDFARWGKWAWYTLHFIIIGGITFGLYMLGTRVPSVHRWLEDMLRKNMPSLTDWFLPLLFLLMYALSWILRWIWLQLGPEADVDEFPDITQAWAEGRDRLAAKGVRLADLPLFLILGQTKAGDEHLFKAGQVPIDIFGPATGAPPVRVWASRDAIYVTAPGASALGTFAELLHHGPGELAGVGSTSEAAKKTVGLGDDDSSLDATVQEINALRALARTRELTPDEKARMRELAVAAQQKPAKASISLTADLAKESGDRLRYLCKLIARDRRPFCPINGLLVLIPWDCVESDDPVKSAALALRTDLLTARNGLRLAAPTLAMVCDVEEARGFEQFLAGFSSSDKAARIGQRFPLVPDQDLDEQPLLYESGSRWLGERLFPGRVYHALQIDVRDGRSIDARNLFQLFRQAQERMPRLGRLLRTGLPMPTGTADGLDGPVLFAGCYLAGTGRGTDQQAFVPGVFERLTENQGVVSWTQGAIVADASYRRAANIGLVFVVALTAIIIGGSVWLWNLKHSAS